MIAGTIYQEVISYNNTNDAPPVVEGNGEINASSSSSSISSGNVIFFERDSKQGFSSGGVKKRVRFGSDRVGSGRVGSGRVGSGRVGSGRVGSG